MKFFLLKLPNDLCGWDMTIAAVVAATDEENAREIVTSAPGWNPPQYWDKATIIELNEINYPVQELILCDFNAG